MFQALHVFERYKAYRKRQLQDMFLFHRNIKMSVEQEHVLQLALSIGFTLFKKRIKAY